MRIPANFQDPPSFTPTASQQATIAARQLQVRQHIKSMFDDTDFRLLADPGTRRSQGGVLYVIPMMLGKAALRSSGRNVLDHWHYFRVWMQTSWRRFLWESYMAEWMSVATEMESTFYTINFDGTLLSGGLWTPMRVPEIAGFRDVDEDEVLYRLHVIGGTSEHEDLHARGTLIQIPQTVEVVANRHLIVAPEILFGKPPYSTSLGAPRPTWVSLNAAAYGSVFLQPPANIAQKDYDVPVIVTDATGEADTATWIVTVTS